MNERLKEQLDSAGGSGASPLLSGNIYVYRPTRAFVDCGGVAYSADGDEIAWHVSSSHSWFQRDMGLIGENKHDKYSEKYPGGYQLIEVIGREALQSHIESGDITGLTFDLHSIQVRTRITFYHPCRPGGSER